MGHKISLNFEVDHLKEVLIKYLIDRIYAVYLKAQSDNYDVRKMKILLVLVTRKGYWMYKVWYKDIVRQWKISHPDLSELEEIVTVCTDRYVLKDFDFKIVQDRYVLLVDDTVNSGDNIYYYYCCYQKNHARRVDVAVYAASTVFLKMKEEILAESDEQKIISSLKFLQYKRLIRNEKISVAQAKKDAGKYLKEFCENLTYYCILSPDQMSELSVAETEYIQRHCAPYVMDLPILMTSDQEENELSITLQKKEWEDLCKDDFLWSFEDISRNDFSGETNIGFFRLDHDYILENIESIFMNFVVVVKHTIEKEVVHATFVPFAIIKSLTYGEVWELFEFLYKGTSYYQMICGEISKETRGFGRKEKAVNKIADNHNLGRALMRSIVYYPSMYIGKMFEKKFVQVTGKTLKLKESIMQENNIDAFKSVVLDMWSNFDVEKERTKLFFNGIKSKVKQFPDNRVRSRRELYDCDKQRDITQYIHFRILDKKRNKDSLLNRLLTIESIESELQERYEFWTVTEKKNAITKSIILLTEYSCMGKEILLDNNNQIIYRGFRAGENSEAIFADNFIWAYIYAFALYCAEGVNKYREKIKMIMDRAEKFYKQKDYMGSLVRESDFNTYKDYLIRIENPDEQIQNKKFLLNTIEDGSARYGKIFLAQEAFRNVNIWLFQTASGRRFIERQGNPNYDLFVVLNQMMRRFFQKEKQNDDTRLSDGYPESLFEIVVCLTVPTPVWKKIPEKIPNLERLTCVRNILRRNFVEIKDDKVKISGFYSEEDNLPTLNMKYFNCLRDIMYTEHEEITLKKYLVLILYNFCGLLQELFLSDLEKAKRFMDNIEMKLQQETGIAMPPHIKSERDLRDVFDELNTLEDNGYIFELSNEWLHVLKGYHYYKQNTRKDNIDQN